MNLFDLPGGIKIKILVVEPMKMPYEKEIKGDLREMQDIVGGTIQAVYPFQDMAAIVCNDDGKLIGLPPNRFLRDGGGEPYDVICGTFFVVGLGREDFISLTDKQVETYKNMYSREAIFRVPKKEKNDHER